MTRKLFNWLWALWIFHLDKCKPEEIFRGCFVINVPKMGTPEMMDILSSLWGMRPGPFPVESYKRKESYKNGTFFLDFWTNLEEHLNEDEIFEDMVEKLYDFCEYKN